MFNLDGLKQITETVSLNYLAYRVPLDSLQCLNEPIDLYSINAKDAPSDGLGKSNGEVKDATGAVFQLLPNRPVVKVADSLLQYIESINNK